MKKIALVWFLVSALSFTAFTGLYINEVNSAAEDADAYLFEPGDVQQFTFKSAGESCNGDLYPPGGCDGPGELTCWFCDSNTMNGSGGRCVAPATSWDTFVSYCGGLKQSNQASEPEPTPEPEPEQQPESNPDVPVVDNDLLDASQAPPPPSNQQSGGTDFDSSSNSYYDSCRTNGKDEDSCRVETAGRDCSSRLCDEGDLFTCQFCYDGVRQFCRPAGITLGEFNDKYCGSGDRTGIPDETGTITKDEYTGDTAPQTNENQESNTQQANSGDSDMLPQPAQTNNQNGQPSSEGSFSSVSHSDINSAEEFVSIIIPVSNNLIRYICPGDTNADGSFQVLDLDNLSRNAQRLSSNVRLEILDGLSDGYNTVNYDVSSEQSAREACGDNYIEHGEVSI